jgi:hypothetical protein
MVAADHHHHHPLHLIVLFSPAAAAAPAPPPRPPLPLSLLRGLTMASHSGAARAMAFHSAGATLDTNRKARGATRGPLITARTACQLTTP